MTSDSLPLYARDECVPLSRAELSKLNDEELMACVKGGQSDAMELSPDPLGKVREQALTSDNKGRYGETSILADGRLSDHTHLDQIVPPYVAAQAPSATVLLCSSSCKSRLSPLGQLAMEAHSV